MIDSKMGFSLCLLSLSHQAKGTQMIKSINVVVKANFSDIKNGVKLNLKPSLSRYHLPLS